MYRVLCVEDEIDFRVDIADFLRMNDCEVVEAGNGIQALELIESEPPFDVVLCDIMMPDMGGHELLEKVRASQKEHQYLPFVFLSALTNRQVADEVRLPGCDDYTTKPIDFAVLIATIKTRVERTRAALYILKVQREGLLRRMARHNNATAQTSEDDAYADNYEALSAAAATLLETMPDELHRSLHRTVRTMYSTPQASDAKSDIPSMPIPKPAAFTYSPPLTRSQKPIPYEHAPSAGEFAEQVAARALGDRAGEQLLMQCDTEPCTIGNEAMAHTLSLFLKASAEHFPEQMQGFSLTQEEGQWVALVADKAEHIYDEAHSFIEIIDATDIRLLPEPLRLRLVPYIMAEYASRLGTAALAIKCVGDSSLVVRITFSTERRMEHLPESSMFVAV